MARRTLALSPARALAAVVLAAVLAPVAALAWRAGGTGAAAAPDWAALRFTLVQAALSAGLSVGLAVPVARALARRRFPGRGVLVAALGAPFLLPSVVAVLGIVAVFGRAGWANAALAAAGLPAIPIYGLQGVVLAHVFFNLPLAVRLVLMGWEAIPAERFRLAAALGFDSRAIARHLERPMLREVLPGAAVLVFALCLTSFAVALILGGGPAATTLELAIYQALRFDYDLGAAARLGLMQLGLCALAWAAAARVGLPAGFGPGLGRAGGPPGPGGWRRAADALALMLAALFLGLPLAAVAARGLAGLGSLPPAVWPALARSLAVALAAAAAAAAAGLVLARAAARGERIAGLAATLPLAASPLVLGTGLFVLLRPWASPAALALPVTAAANAALALPFVHRALAPAAAAMAAQDRLADSLGLAGAARLRRVTLPVLARPLGFSAGIAAALAMGDLGAIALFAGEGQATLPLVVQRLQGAYRSEAAAGAALVLVAASLALYALLDGIGRRAGA